MKTLAIIKKALPDADENTTKENSGDWDSVTHLQIIMEIEEAYQLKIPIDDMAKLTSVKLIEEYIYG